jgi:hypothetical protein
MSKTLIPIILLSALAFLAIGCDPPKQEDAKEQAPEQAKSAPAPAPDPAAGHAPPGVKPGSHEDWCGGHQVPESLCTRCNPSLIAAFQATGDWCAEHGLPESQCLVCNPDLKIVRPPPAGEASP